MLTAHTGCAACAPTMCRTRALPLTSMPDSFMDLAMSVRAMVLETFRPATSGFSVWSTPAAAAAACGGTRAAILLLMRCARAPAAAVAGVPPKR